MKKAKIIIILLITFILGIAAAVGTYFALSEEVDWQRYIEETLMPNIVTAAATISALYIAAMPVLNLIKKTASNFSIATDKISKTSENDEQTLKKLEEYEKRIADFEKKFASIVDILDAKFDDIDSKISTVSEGTQKLEKMSMIGFGNMSELVKGGYAAEIGKVYKNEKNKIKNPTSFSVRI